MLGLGLGLPQVIIRNRLLPFVPPVPADFLVSNNNASGPNSWADVLANSDAVLAGKTISVAPGIYDQQIISNKNPATPLTITALNPMDRPIIKGFRIGGTSKLTFSKLKIVRDDWTSSANSCVMFTAGAVGDLVFDDNELYHGYRGDYNAPFNATRGFVYPEYASIPATISGGVISIDISPARPINRFVGGLLPDGVGYPLYALTPALTGTGVNGSGFAGTFDVIGGFIANETVTNGGSGYSTSLVQFSRIIGWDGRVAFGNNIAYGFQSQGASSIGNLTFTNNNLHDLCNGIKVSPTNGGTMLVEGNRFTRIYQDFIATGVGKPPFELIVRWNVGDFPFSAIGDPDDPHSDAIQLFADDIGPLNERSTGTMVIEAIGNIFWSGTNARGYFQSFLASDSPNDILAGGTNDFAFSVTAKYNMFLTRALSTGVLFTNIKDSYIWRNNNFRYKFDDVENSGTTTNFNLGDSDIAVATGAASSGTNLIGGNIVENFSFKPGTVVAIDNVTFPNVVLGGGGSRIPYASVLAAPLSEPLTVADILTAFRTDAAYPGIGAWTNDGAVDYVARTINLALEPTFVRFLPQFDVSQSTATESARTKAMGGPATRAYTVTGGTLREYTTETGGTATVMPAFGNITRGRWYTLSITTAAAQATTTTASLTIGSDMYPFNVTTVATPFFMADNGGTAYSTITDAGSDTLLRKFVFAATFELENLAVSARIFSGSTGSPLNLTYIPSGSKLRFQLGSSAICLFDINDFVMVANRTTTVVITLDFTKLTVNEAVKVVINGLPYSVNGISYDPLPSGGVGTRTFSASSFGSLNVLALSNGTGLADGGIAMFYADWGQTAYTLINPTTPAVYNRFSLDFILADGSGPTTAQPKFCYYGTNDAQWNAGLANRGTVQPRVLTKIAGTYGAAAAAISSVASSGWVGTYNGTSGELTALELVPGFGALTSESWATTPTLRPITVTRAGYSDTGTATTFNETVYMTKRDRLPSLFNPATNSNDAGPFTFTSTGVLLSERVHAADTVAGATNSSTQVSPKPLGAWTSCDRDTVTSVITVGAVFAHWAARQGRQVRAVEFYATDGVNPVVASGKILNPTLSSYTGDPHAYPHWSATLDVGGLNNGKIEVYAIAWPWVGVAASVLDSRDTVFSTDYWRFANQIYRKVTPATQWIAVVKATASGAPAVNQVEATARTNFYGSIDAAIAALYAANGNILDGCRLLIADNVTWNQGITQREQNISGLIVERDSTVALGSAVLTIGANSMRIGNVASLTAPLVSTAIIFRNLRIDITAALAGGGTGGSSVHIKYDNCDVAKAYVSTAPMFATTVRSVDSFGTRWTNINGTNLQVSYVAASATFKHRGSTVTNTASWVTNGFQTIGCLFADTTGALVSSKLFSYPSVTGNLTVDGQMHWHSKFFKHNAAGIVTSNQQTIVRGVAIINCLAEAVGTAATNQPFYLSDDGVQGSVNNVIYHNNTVVGYDTAGSGNNFYDDLNNAVAISFSASSVANTPIAGQSTLTLTVAASALPTAGQVIGARTSGTAMTSDMTIVSASGTTVGSTWVVTSAQTFGAKALSIGATVDTGVRTHTRISYKGNIYGRAASKGDIFKSFLGGPGASNLSTPQASARQGNAEWDNQIGCADNNFTWLSNFFRGYDGINSRAPVRDTANISTNAGTTETIVANKPSQWVNWQATSGPPLSLVAGPGNGDYHTTAGHPSKNLCLELYTSHDLDGLARVAVTNNSAGCYR